MRLLMSKPSVHTAIQCILGLDREVLPAVQVGGHDGQIARAVLAVGGPTQLDLRDLGDGIGPVGRLPADQRTTQSDSSCMRWGQPRG